MTSQQEDDSDDDDGGSPSPVIPSFKNKVVTKNKSRKDKSLLD